MASTPTIRGTLAIAVMAILPATTFAQAEPGRRACFRLKDSAPRATYHVTFATGGGGPQSCAVKVPAKLACFDATVTSMSPNPPGEGPAGSASGSMLCYTARCGRAFGGSNAEDQFGTRVIAFRKMTQLLCLPASINPPAAGSTTTTTTEPGATTTTTQPGNETCHFTDGQCVGTCAASSQRCGAAVGTGSCECRDVACGDAGAPACNGACSDPGKACVFDLSGCSCVKIP
jgi:hypothetical protein